MKYLPTTTDPCGQVTYTLRNDSNEGQYLGRIDYQRTSNDTIFGRYMATSSRQADSHGRSDTALSLYDAANNRSARVRRSGPVAGHWRHARVRLQHGQLASVCVQPDGVDRIAPDTFEPHDLGLRRLQLLTRTSWP